MFADQATAAPAGQVSIGAERNATGTAALPLTPGRIWRRPSTAPSFAVRRTASSRPTAISGAMAASTGVLRIGGNGDLGRVVCRPDRRGARLQPGAQRRGDPAGHAGADRLTWTKERAATEVAALQTLRGCGHECAPQGEAFVIDVPMNVKPSLEPYILSCCVSEWSEPSTRSTGASYSPFVIALESGTDASPT